MPNIPALHVTKHAVQCDPAMQPHARGDRKLLVTRKYDDMERDATEIGWSPPERGEPCPVQEMPDTELAVFNQFAKQDRHKHAEGTEIYMVIDGRMVIEVDGVDYPLSRGDMIVVNPNACHRVKPEDTEFLCRVVTVNCGGALDKHPC